MLVMDKTIIVYGISLPIPMPKKEGSGKHGPETGGSLPKHRLRNRLYAILQLFYGTPFLGGKLTGNTQKDIIIEY